MRETRDLVGLYDALAKWQWMLRPRLKVHEPGVFAMHKRLKEPINHQVDAQALPSAGASELPRWIGKMLLLGQSPHQTEIGRVLDVGCGFGATLLHLAKFFGATGVGITNSGYQVRRARQLAKRFGLSQQCEFEQASFDDLSASGFNAFVAVEALFHARDLTQTMTKLASAVGGQGHGLIVEDIAEPEAFAHPAGMSLAKRWHTPRFPDSAAYLHAVQSAGFEIEEDIDLSSQVGFRGDDELSRSEQKLARWRGRIPQRGARAIIDAFAGGLDLERLYAEGLMKYRCLRLRVRNGGAPL